MAHVGHFLARLVALGTAMLRTMLPRRAGHCAMLRTMLRREGGLYNFILCAVLKATSAHTFCSVSVARTPSVAFQVVVALVVLLLADPEIARGAVQCCALRNAALGCKTARVAVAHWENTHILHTHLGTCYQRALLTHRYNTSLTRPRAFVDTVTCYVDTAEHSHVLG